MRHLRLIAFEDEPTGNLGLIVKGCDSPEIYADSSGTLIAHDIVEHQNGMAAIGGIDDELEAIGALWQVRGRHGTFLSREPMWRGLYETLGQGDVAFCAHNLDSAEETPWYPRIGQYRTARHDYDDDFREILDHARRDLERSMEQRDAEVGPDFPIDAYLDNALHLMRMGFNKAKRRWGMDWKGADTFQAIRDAVAPFAKHCEFAGQEFILSYGNGEARCREIEVADD